MYSTRRHDRRSSNPRTILKLARQWMEAALGSKQQQAATAIGARERAAAALPKSNPSPTTRAEQFGQAGNIEPRSGGPHPSSIVSSSGGGRARPRNRLGRVLINSRNGRRAGPRNRGAGMPPAAGFFGECGGYLLFVVTRLSRVGALLPHDWLAIRCNVRVRGAVRSAG